MRTRRQFLVVVLGISALGVSPCALAQKQGKVWRVGVLASRRRPDSLDSDYYGGLPRGLHELGYIEGKNLSIEWRFADGKYERLPALAAELVRLDVDVIVTDGTPTTLAAQKATKTISIVFGSAGDPIGNGLVKSLTRPGGNTTGISLVAGDTIVGAKQIELLTSMVPRLNCIGVLLNPMNRYSYVALASVRAAAEPNKVKIVSVEAQDPEGIDKAFSVFTREHTGALLFTPDPFFNQQLGQIAGLALQNRLPSSGGLREYAEAGGLMSYGQNRTENFHAAAVYVDKIFKGAKPGDLPVQQPMKPELVINRKTANALGLKIPAELLVLADKVIE